MNPFLVTLWAMSIVFSLFTFILAYLTTDPGKQEGMWIGFFISIMFFLILSILCGSQWDAIYKIIS
jgi:hypothetical protein